MIYRLSQQDKDNLIEFARDLVRIPSLPTQEREVARRLKKEMQKVGFAVSKKKDPTASAFVRNDRVGNIVGELAFSLAPNAKKLLFEGHMDTVDVGDEAAWKHPPYSAEMKNGTIYGRGAVDMKSSLAAMVYAAKLLLDNDVRLDGAMYIVGIVQEEPSEGAALRVLVEEEGLKPDYVVLGEPSNLMVSRGHRGRMEMIVDVEGKAAHAATPRLGVNAIYEAALVVGEVETKDYPAPPPPYTDLGKGTIAVTQIESFANSRNAVPARCRLYLDRRLTWGDTEERALKEVRRMISDCRVTANVCVNESEYRSYTNYPMRVREYYPAWMISEDHPLVQASLRAARAVLGRSVETSLWQFSTDGVYSMGEAGIPTVGFGPGEEKYAHTVDEQIRAADIIEAAEVYAQMAIEILGVQ